MGPAVDTAGNRSTRGWDSNLLKLLQWGQRLIPLETGATQSQRLAVNLIASMGPAVDTAGNLTHDGNTTDPINWLQWGQRLIPLETYGTACRD